MKFIPNRLDENERSVILNKNTEKPFSGRYNDFYESGTYICKQCGLPLFKSEDKFNSGCGWPSFDDEIPSAIERKPEKDGRIEITCSFCGAHLGHVFEGENFTTKNIRHCVNSISLDFIQAGNEIVLKRALFAGGCFWGVEHLFKDIEGVLQTKVGYIGGSLKNPSYDEVCSGSTGHVEAVLVVYDSTKISYEELAKIFFEIHDFTQLNRQGPDFGEQYRSVVFCFDYGQMETALKIISELKKMGYDVKTELKEALNFFPAEEYHQNYYEKTGKKPYCHYRRKIF
ncbi:MAG TPA: bifunctional methionine sulfoxide reductase B/A protein [Petrotogaceae bacterium]|nr:bifunctional methionine sulfoxide reductase B/A protein [Petrotogaceae bacterium]